jgi:hypothetical protein
MTSLREIMWDDKRRGLGVSLGMFLKGRKNRHTQFWRLRMSGQMTGGHLGKLLLPKTKER